MRRPKAWLPFAGELMLPRMVRVLGSVVTPLVVVAAPDQDVPPLPADVIGVRDPAKGRGPLQGLAAGLAALESSVDAVYLTGCDAPFLQSAFIRRVIDLLGSADACVPCVGDHHHPLAAVYRVGVLPEVRRRLHEERLRLADLFDAVKTRVVTAEELADVDPTFQSLRNLNTPEDYEQALRDAATS